MTKLRVNKIKETKLKKNKTLRQKNKTFKASFFPFNYFPVSVVGLMVKMRNKRGIIIQSQDGGKGSAICILKKMGLVDC